MIGVLFNATKLRRIVSGKEPYENIQYYKALAKENKVDLLFYTIKSFKGSKVLGYLYSFKQDRYSKISTTIPKVNLIRTIISTKNYYTLKKIEREQHVVFSNLVEGRNKFRIYKYLNCLKNVSDHIPDTERLSFPTLVSSLKKYPSVVVKPINGALGERIFVIEQSSKKVIIRYTAKGKQHKKVLPKQRLSTFYQKEFKHPENYLVQEYIPFETYQGEKFDIRTSAQKDKNGNWRITGIVTRVAGKNGIVTNVAQGGRVVSFKEIRSILTQDVQNQIHQLSLELAKEIEKLNPATMDLGLDIAIDKNGHLWFIEANYCDQRYAYREAKDYEMWEACYRTPFEFAFATYHRMLHSSS